MAGSPNDLLQTILPFAAVAIVLLFRARRMSRPRTLRIERLWIVPALYLALIGVLFAVKPPSAQGWGAAALGLAVGLVLGWQRGRTIRIEIDPATRALTQRASPIAFGILAALVVLRQLAQSEGSALGFDLTLVAEGFMGLALGLLAATRAEMFLRARRMLADAR